MAEFEEAVEIMVDDISAGAHNDLAELDLYEKLAIKINTNRSNRSFRWRLLYS